MIVVLYIIDYDISVVVVTYNAIQLQQTKYTNY